MSDWLADLIAIHHHTYDRYWGEDDGCLCGKRSKGPEDEVGEREHAAHLADVIRAALTSDEAVERAAKALYEEARNASMGFDQWPSWDELSDDVKDTLHARAAVEALVGGDGE